MWLLLVKLPLITVLAAADLGLPLGLRLFPLLGKFLLEPYPSNGKPRRDNLQQHQTPQDEPNGGDDARRIDKERRRFFVASVQIGWLHFVHAAVVFAEAALGATRRRNFTLDRLEF